MNLCIDIRIIRLVNHFSNQHDRRWLDGPSPFAIVLHSIITSYLRWQTYGNNWVRGRTKTWTSICIYLFSRFFFFVTVSAVATHTRVRVCAEIGSQFQLPSHGRRRKRSEERNMCLIKNARARSIRMCRNCCLYFKSIDQSNLADISLIFIRTQFNFRFPAPFYVDSNSSFIQIWILINTLMWIIGRNQLNCYCRRSNDKWFASSSSDRTLNRFLSLSVCQLAIRFESEPHKLSM